MALNRLAMMIRMPGGLKKALVHHAQANLRPLNSEMVARLAASLNGNGKADKRQLSLFGLVDDKAERTKHPRRRRPRVKRTKHARRSPGVKRTKHKGAARG